MNNTTNSVAGSITRHVMTGGGIAGVMSSQDQIIQAVSALITLLGIIWGIVEKVRRPRTNQEPPSDGRASLWLFLLFSVSAFSFLGAGCSAISGTRKPDGTLTITSHRLLWSSEAIDFSVADTNQFKAGLKVKKSNVDAEALSAIAEGVAKGLKP